MNSDRRNAIVGLVLVDPILKNPDDVLNGPTSENQIALWAFFELVTAAAVLELSGIIAQLSAWGVILALPVATFEISCAVYLLARGFRPAALAESANRA